MPLLSLNLKRDEGFRNKPYKDTAGKLTIGFGRNLDDVGINGEEASILLFNDIETAIDELNSARPWVQQKPVAVRLGLYNMAFNLGITRLLKFEKMLDSIEHDDYEMAAHHAMQSKWALQVGPRAERIAELFRSAAKE